MPKAHLSTPILTNNPKQDIVATNNKPLISFFNAKGGSGERTYDIELDTNPLFDSKNKKRLAHIPETADFVTSKRVDSPLNDKRRYYFRVRAKDAAGNKSVWATSRFYVDTTSDDTFMGLVRADVKKVEASSGFNVKNIVDYDDPGEGSFWQSTPPGDLVHTVTFDLGKPQTISRIWMLSNLSGPVNWLNDFSWQKSANRKSWSKIVGTEVKNNDTYRNILDFKPTKARYFRLKIAGWHGYAPQLNEVILYSPGMPKAPKTPTGKYVLVVGNQHNGFTFSELAKHIEQTGLGLKALTVPRYEVSLDMVQRLKNKPLAIVLSGNNADYPNQPMFEYNGEFEIIRESNIPILGICCGHQMLAAAYGQTFIGSMGWSDLSSMRLEEKKPLSKINILKKDDPIFKGIPNNFTAPEVHGWAVLHVPDMYEVIAESGYVQAMKHKTKLIYGKQFHAEIKADYNQGTPFIKNFLKMALVA